MARNAEAVIKGLGLLFATQPCRRSYTTPRDVICRYVAARL